VHRTQAFAAAAFQFFVDDFQQVVQGFPGVGFLIEIETILTTSCFEKIPPELENTRRLIFLQLSNLSEQPPKSARHIITALRQGQECILYRRKALGSPELLYNNIEEAVE
jgi:UPF0288 family protein (methanogenesis marker protein 3)